MCTHSITSKRFVMVRWSGIHLGNIVCIYTWKFYHGCFGRLGLYPTSSGLFWNRIYFDYILWKININWRNILSITVAARLNMPSLSSSCLLSNFMRLRLNIWSDTFLQPYLHVHPSASSNTQTQQNSDSHNDGHGNNILRRFCFFLICKKRIIPPD